MTPYPYCICAPVSEQALKALLEVSGRGHFKDDHPWVVAGELADAAATQGQQLPILFAVGQPSTFSHWGYVSLIEVRELHMGSWQTKVEFTPLSPVNPIWGPLDSLLLKPSDEQLRRESLEQIHQHRHPVTEGELRPYAICETPAFIGVEPPAEERDLEP